MVDKQRVGMAGEFLALGKLLKRGYQASFTLGNAKGIDLFVHDEEKDKFFKIQVKTVIRKNSFLLKKEAIVPDAIYIFVILHDERKKDEDGETFFIIKGKDISENINQFYGSSYRDLSKTNPMPAIKYGSLEQYKNNWQVFDE